MVQTSSRIGTSELLAKHISDPNARRYKMGEDVARKKWLYRQIGACYMLAHAKIPSWEVMTVDTDILDTSMLEDPSVASLTALEIQDAFRLGVTGSYGEFYGINTKTLLGFLQSYVASEKKQSAHLLLRAREDKANKEADERLFNEIQEAKRNGTFSPTWGPSFDFGHKSKEEDSEAHRAKIKAQAEQIYKTL